MSLTFKKPPQQLDRDVYVWAMSIFDSLNTVDPSTYELKANKGVASGYASLDATGKIPVAQLPSAIMEYKGVWDADTNDPTLVDGTGDIGDVYKVSVAGTHNFGSGDITFSVGDYCIYNGTVWEKSGSGGVESVNGEIGVVELDHADLNSILGDAEGYHIAERLYDDLANEDAQFGNLLTTGMPTFTSIYTSGIQAISSAGLELFNDGGFGLKVLDNDRILYTANTPVFECKDTNTSGDNIYGYMSWLDSGDVEKGYFGFAGGNATFYIRNRTAAGDIRFFTSDTEAMRIDSSGNVGIGMTPVNKFDIKADGGGSFCKMYSSSGVERLQIFNDESVGDHGVSLVMRDASSNAVVIESRPGRASYINNGGKFGIGTSTMDTNFHIKGASSAVGIKLETTDDALTEFIADSNRASAGNSIFRLRGYWDGTEVAKLEFFAGEDDINKDDGNIRIQVASGGSLSEVIRINSIGNIGFNTTDIESSGSTFKAIEGYASTLIFGTSDAASGLAQNAYHDGAWKRKIADEAAMVYLSTSGDILFRVAGSDSADSTISWTQALKIDNTGIIDMAKQSSCRVYLTSAQTISDSTSEKIEFDDEEWDTQSEFDATTDHDFTAKNDGKYLVVLNIYWSGDLSSGTTARIQTRVNGTTVRDSYQYNGPGSQSYSCILDLDANDIVAIYAYHTEGSGVRILNNNNYTYMEIHKLS